MGPNSRGGAANKGKPQQHKFSTWTPKHLTKGGGRKTMKKPASMVSNRPGTGKDGGAGKSGAKVPEGAVDANTPRISLRPAVLARLMQFIMPDVVAAAAATKPSSISMNMEPIGTGVRSGMAAVRPASVSVSVPKAAISLPSDKAKDGKELEGTRPGRIPVHPRLHSLSLSLRP